ncbi:MAG: 30S ribosomal protein S12 methylthiotransferase RimO, partial [Ruminococcaceae bacterium]|nr:30S ribosomal protein S12 methylthiotransferase RimO [Oscillospiraceae bacterium]
MALKVGMVSLGCCKNQVDAEIMLALVKQAGFELCTEPGLCDVVIVNTCGFIEDAKRESIENILEFCQLKKEGQIKAVVVTGCLAERYREEIASEIPEADVILGIGSNEKIVSAIKKAVAGEKVVLFGEKNELPLNGDRIISNLPFYAYLKLADGCDNFCTYCAIPYIRGRYRSRKIEDVMKEAEHLAKHGVKELVLVAQDTTRYGEDLYGKSVLPELLDRLQKLDGLKWIRMLYCYPDKITDELIDAINRNDKVLPYLDVPVQHISTPILKAMNRRDTEETLRALFSKLRREIPGVVLRTTLIAGFPGETEEDFEKLCRFVQEEKFERLGCFAYSQEEGTAAAKMDGQLDEEIKKHRAEVVMDTQYPIAEAYNRSQIGKTLEVVVEGFDKYAECFFGRSTADAPDIDPKVFFTSKIGHSTGEFVP